jgi:hypothetical protein
MSAVMATFGKVQMTCRVCTRPEAVERRAEWGCDGPAPHSLFDIECPRCFGFRHDCQLCEGSGLVSVDRCPWATATPAMMEVCELHAMSESGILPVAGGWREQSKTFVDAFRIAGGVRATIERKRQEKEARDAKGAARG